ncbi:hypothetical protein C8R45DRAFT_842883, partial [Mycena sanguinolenta]
MTDPETLNCLEPLSITNEPPRKHESALIRHFVEKTSICLASLDAEISEVKDRLQQLKEQRTALSGLHARSKKILSPQRQMPPEILGEIFAWTLPSAHDIFGTRRCPWILTHVCSRWRAVALSIPSLWSL